MNNMSYMERKHFAIFQGRTPLDIICQYRDRLEKVLPLLTPRQERIIRGRFGIGASQTTLAALGEEFGIGRERVRQLEWRGALEILKIVEPLTFASKEITKVKTK